jgi:arsenate reductase
LKIAGGETLINRRGTTYRALTDAEKAALDTADTALPILSEKSALMKRPIFEIDQALFVGFTAEAQAALIGAGS